MERGYTFTKKNTVVFEWKITGVSSYLKQKDKFQTVLDSSEFTTGCRIGDKWKVRLYINYLSTTDNPRDDIAVTLFNLSAWSVTPVVKFFILNVKQDKVSMKTLEREIASEGNRGFSDFIDKNELLDNMSELIPNDILTVCTEVTVSDDAVTIPIEQLCDSSKSQLASDLKKLYESKDNSDVTIIVGDEKFQAHKAILGARSPVLAAMFTHDMIEKKSNEVFVTDIDPKIFEIMLKYIYTDQVSDLGDVAAGVLEVADKYQLQLLKQICEVALMRCLCRENIINTVVLADRHNAKSLKDYVIKCIVADAAEIIETDHFKELETSNSLLTLELLKNIAVAKISNKSKVIQTY